MKFIAALVILLIVLIFLAFSGLTVREVFSFFIELYGERISKIKLARWYGLNDTRTLNKWVETYCKEIPQAWSNCKKVTAEMLVVIFKNLGLPFLQKSYTKAELQLELQMTAPTLRKKIFMQDYKIGFTEESQFKNTIIFPPLISRNIIRTLG